MINPAGVQHQIHGNVIQSISRVLKEEVTFTSTAVAPKEWGGYPIITFPEVRPIDLMMVPRQDQPPLDVGESASVPSAAAIANAIYDSNGVRFRELPFTPKRVRAGLAAVGSAPSFAALPPPSKQRRRFWAGLGLGIASLAFPMNIRPVMAGWNLLFHRPGAYKPDPARSATWNRGAYLVEGLGHCAVCHEPGALPQFGVQPNLAFNSNLQSAGPDNLIRIILEGIQAPALDHLGAMPSFAQSLNDDQIADLVGFLRRHYAPNQESWSDLTETVARLRKTGSGS